MTRGLTDQLRRRIASLCTPLAPIPTEVAPRLEPLAARAALFDVYGTLLVSGSGDVGTAMETDSGAAFAGALAALGMPHDKAAAKRGAEALFEEIRQEHTRRLAKSDTRPEVEIRGIWRRVFERLREEGTVERGLSGEEAARLAVEYECRANPVWPMPEAAETLAALRERGVPMGIVSNAQFYTPLTLEALFGRSLAELGFSPDLCAWSHEAGLAKPATELFEPVLARLRERFGVAAREALYVGNDMRNDILAASRCGCKTCLFAGDRRSLRLREDDPECRGVRPHAVATRMSQALSLIAGAP